MVYLGSVIRRLFHRGLAAVLMLAAFPALVLAQPDSAVSSTTSGTSSSTTTTTTTEWVSDWRLWALLGAVLLVIIIVAATRGGRGDRTTVVK